MFSLYWYAPPPQHILDQWLLDEYNRTYPNIMATMGYVYNLYFQGK